MSRHKPRPGDVWANAAERRMSREQMSGEAEVHHMPQEENMDRDKILQGFRDLAKAGAGDRLHQVVSAATHERPSQGNEFTAGPSELAAGHPSSPSRVPGAPGTQLDFQRMAPSSVPQVSSDPSRQNPMADAITAHVPMMEQLQAVAAFHGSSPFSGVSGAAGAAHRPEGIASIAPGRMPSRQPGPTPGRGRGIFNQAPNEGGRR